MRIFLSIAIAAMAGMILAAYAAGVDVAQLPHDRGSVSFTDRSGASLGTVSASDSEHAAWVPLERVAPVFLEAIVATEDARYYRHGAVDWFALGRALREYIIFGAARSGGSTIAMQLARSLWPTPSTIRGKLTQIIGAQRITLRSSPSAILEAYINRLPMGGNLYGIEAAARTYFGVPARDLDLAQAALLAAIPNDPARLSQYDHWQALRQRQRYVLGRMVLQGDITPEQGRSAGAEQVHLLPRNDGLIAAQHLLFWLYPQVPPGTAEIRTTVDESLQQFVQTQVAEVVSALGERHVTDAAALVVDNQTGDVLAYVGSPDYFADSALGRNDGVQALRQPGSSLKPFTYEVALERGTIRSSTILADVPTTYAIPGGKLYQPADYSTRFAGPVRIRYALANSLNVPAVRVLESLGVGPFLARLRQLGFAHLNKPADFYGLGLTLGSGEVSLWELTHAYATIARLGRAIPMRTRADQTAPAPVRIGDAATWALVTDMLADPHARAQSFGLHSVLEMPFPAAVKTGTSSDFRDTWTVGFSRDYTVGVWVGNFDGSPMRGVSGVTGAGPLWNRIMLHLHESREPGAFPPPAGYAREPICATTGRRPDRACAAVVSEWIRPDDAAWVQPAPATVPRDEDVWLAEQPGARIAGVRIAFPRSGDTFVYDADVDAVARASQRIELRAVGEGRPIRWNVGKQTQHADSSGVVLWPLHVGTWLVRAADGMHTDAVTIRVVPPPHGSHPGFSFTTR